MRRRDDGDTVSWLKFAVCTALIGLAGLALTRYGDVIARLTGLSRSWVGLVLLATATSLPELFTAMRAAFTYERRVRPPPEFAEVEGGISLRVAALRYATAAIVVIVAGSWLPFVGQEIGDTMGWKTTFVGALFIAGPLTEVSERRS